jgi:hypothetical protein
VEDPCHCLSPDAAATGAGKNVFSCNMPFFDKKKTNKKILFETQPADDKTIRN